MSCLQILLLASTYPLWSLEPLHMGTLRARGTWAMMSHSAAWGPRPEGTTPCCRVHSRAPWSPAESGPHPQSHFLWLLFLPSPAARTPSKVSRRITSSVNAGPRGSLWGSPSSRKTSSRKPELGSEYCGGGGEVKTVPGGRTGGGRTAAPKLMGG